MSFKRFLLVFVTVILYSSKPLFGQFYYGMQMDFGKNRIQYQTFDWTYFEFDRYKVYMYAGGKEIAQYVSVSIDKELPIMEKRLGQQFDDKIQVLVYNNQNDFKQSNLGLAGEDMSNIGGVTHIIGNKINVFFNGSHADLDRQIRAALAELMIDKIMYGGRARDMVRNSSLLVLPDWYKQGLVKYLSEGWNTYADNYLMDAIKNDRFYKFSQLTGKDAYNAGHALWYYIAETYGESAIQNVLWATRINRSADQGLLQSAPGSNVSNLIYELCEAFNKRYYNYKDTTQKMPVAQEVLHKQKKTRHYYNLKVSPDGQKAIYASNELGQFKVWINTVGEEKQKRLLKFNPKVERLDDYNYPLLAWHPNNEIVAMIYERKNQLILHTYDVVTKEKFKRNITGFEKINSFSFSHDGKKLVMSAVKKGKGQSDIFIFLMNSGGLEQMTNDIWDDNNPTFIQNSTGIVFESNRVSDTIRWTDDAKVFYKITRNNDLFYLSYNPKSQIAIRVTNTPDINETQAQEYSKQTIAYLSEKNGVYNRYVAQFDSSISFVDTVEHYRYFFNSKAVSNYNRNVIEQNINSRYTKKGEIFYNNGRYVLAVSDLTREKDLVPPELKNSWFKSSERQSIFDPEKISIRKIKQPMLQEKSVNPPDTAKKQTGIDFNNYNLTGEKSKPKENQETPVINKPAGVDTAGRSTVTQNEFRFPTQQNYYTAFYTDYVVTQLDNSYLSTNYQRFTGGSNPVYLNPGLNALFKIGLSDLFEDRRIVAGFRIAGSLDNEYMLSFENRKRLIDHQLVLHRQAFLKVNSFYGEVAKVTTQDVRYSIKLPFSEVSATRFSLLYRNDRAVFASVGDFSLAKKNTYDNYGGARLEYIFDNTRKRGLNLFNGVRLKVWVEYWRLIKEDRHDLITGGFDIRGYKKLHRDLIWCNRLAGGTSWGTDKLIYYLGGVDSWFNPKFDNSINVVKSEEYQFQTLATNMRGFKQNIRNGNNFAVWNSELRFPIFRYLYNRPIKSDFVNNFQIIAFGDLGMAWYGTNPLSEDNTLNKNIYYGNPITLTIYNQKNPLVAGVGFGVRSRLLGYFVRLDFGWGIDDMKVQKSITYLSFTTDF
jgi:Tol biopolymer transport system component